MIKKDKRWSFIVAILLFILSLLFIVYKYSILDLRNFYGRGTRREFSKSASSVVNRNNKFANDDFGDLLESQYNPVGLDLKKLKFPLQPTLGSNIAIAFSKIPGAYCILNKTSDKTTINFYKNSIKLKTLELSTKETKNLLSLELNPQGDTFSLLTSTASNDTMSFTYCIGKAEGPALGSDWFTSRTVCKLTEIRSVPVYLSTIDNHRFLTLNRIVEIDSNSRKIFSFSLQVYSLPDGSLLSETEVSQQQLHPIFQASPSIDLRLSDFAWYDHDNKRVIAGIHQFRPISDSPLEGLISLDIDMRTPAQLLTIQSSFFLRDLNEINNDKIVLFKRGELFTFNGNKIGGNLNWPTIPLAIDTSSGNVYFKYFAPEEVFQIAFLKT